MESIVSIIVAFITGGLALVGVIFTNTQSNRQIENKLITAQAVTDQKIEQLAEEVRKHNSHSDRITTLEVKVANLEKEVFK